MENRGAREREERDTRVGGREREERDLEYRGRRAREDMDKRNTGREREEMNMKSSYKMSVPNAELPIVSSGSSTLEEPPRIFTLKIICSFASL